jgi:hypothetical protein
MCTVRTISSKLMVKKLNDFVADKGRALISKAEPIAISRSKSVEKICERDEQRKKVLPSNIQLQPS